MLVFLVVFLLRESLPALREIGLARFFTDPAWSPTEGSFGMAPMLAGTGLAAGGAVVLAAPLGVLSAVFRCFYAPAWLGRLYLRMIEVMAGVPSVVWGFWGLVVLVPIIGGLHPPGPSLLAAALILALMILPTIALAADASLRVVPREALLAAAALGCRRWTVVRRVALPAAAGGVGAGVLLGVGRAIGETMAVLMVAGNVVRVPGSVFDPVRTLTANIALEMAYALDAHRAALFVSGLLLTALVVVLVALAEQLRTPGTAVRA